MLMHVLFLAAGATSSVDVASHELPGSGHLLYRQELSSELFPAARSRIENLFAPGEIHASLGNTRQRQVLRHLEQIERLLESPLPSPKRQSSRLELHLRKVNEMLVSGRLSASSEVICRREARSGSRRPQTFCYDREEMEEIAQEHRAMLRETKCRLAGARLQFAEGRSGDQCR